MGLSAVGATEVGWLKVRVPGWVARLERSRPPAEREGCGALLPPTLHLGERARARSATGGNVFDQRLKIPRDAVGGIHCERRRGFSSGGGDVTREQEH